MTKAKKMIAVAITSVLFVACRKDVKAPDASNDARVETISARSAKEGNDSHGGHVYTLSNQADGNKVMVYRRGDNGELQFLKSYPTGGNGTGSGLGSQGSIFLSNRDNILLAVNAGSNSISSFSISNDELNLVSTVSSNGIRPISITGHGDLVYVVNAGGNGNISGFRINANGKLTSIPHSDSPLSSTHADPAQISFVNEGAVLVITEKAANEIISYTVDGNGRPGVFHSLSSANAGPFGFAVGDHGKIFVSEAAGGAPGLSSVSAYHVNDDGVINLINGPVSAGQTAACWVVVTDDGRYVYATNTGSSTVSSFEAGPAGNISILRAAAAATGTTPTDAALSDQSRFLYTLNAGGHSISVFKVDSNGDLNSIQTVTGLPVGDIGLAAE